MKIAIGTDHRGFEVKNNIIKNLSFNFIDCGTYAAERCGYGEFAKNVVDKVSNNEAQFGILICGSGVGVSIMANRYKKIRAALCYSKEVAIATRQHNNANIACFGATFMTEKDITESILAFIETKFLNIEPYISAVNLLSLD